MERNLTKQNNKKITKANKNKLYNKFADTNLLEKYYWIVKKSTKSNEKHVIFQ